MEDLWSFSKESLEAEVSNVNSILKEQAKLLTQKTGGVLEGRITNKIFGDETDEYNLETIFEIRVPNLSGYVCSLFYVYSNVKRNFPIGISYESVRYSNVQQEGKERHMRMSHIQCEVWDDRQFKEILKEILSSKKINETISVLYSKATNN